MGCSSCRSVPELSDFGLDLSKYKEDGTMREFYERLRAYDRVCRKNKGALARARRVSPDKRQDNITEALQECKTAAIKIFDYLKENVHLDEAGLRYLFGKTFDEFAYEPQSLREMRQMAANGKSDETWQDFASRFADQFLTFHADFCKNGEPEVCNKLIRIPFWALGDPVAGCFVQVYFNVGKHEEWKQNLSKGPTPDVPLCLNSVEMDESCGRTANKIRVNFTENACVLVEIEDPDLGDGSRKIVFCKENSTDIRSGIITAIKEAYTHNEKMQSLHDDDLHAVCFDGDEAQIWAVGAHLHREAHVQGPLQRDGKNHESLDATDLVFV